MRACRPVVLSMALAAGVAAGAACAPPRQHFSDDNAQAHVNSLATSIGSRPAGTDASRRARAYIVEQLELYGFTVRVQDAESTLPGRALTVPVHNIIAVRPGAQPDAVGLLAHYDSVPWGPGGGDDAFGVAVVLESARLLAARQSPRHSLMVLVTDAEELGLMGARALVEDAEVRQRLKAYLNLESVGPSGPAPLFEWGPGNGWLVEAWARSAPHPHGASYFYEVYRRLPNDTDFSVFREAGIPGLNFAAIGNSFAYHTSRDTASRVSRDAMRRLGRNVVAIVDALERVDLTRRTADERVFFDVARLSAIVWPAPLARIVEVIALACALFGLFRMIAAGRRIGGVRSIVLGVVWGAAGGVLVAAAMTGGVALLRAVREVYHPWYAQPDRLAALIVASGACAAWLVFRLAVHLPAAARPARHGAFAWIPALGAWTIVAAAAAWFLPSASYLWTLPAGFAGLLLAGAGGNRTLVAATSVLSGVFNAVLWLPDLAVLFPFLNAILGRLPIVAPVFVHPAVAAAGALMLAPPLVGLLASMPGRRPRYVTRALLTATAFAFGWCYLGDAYTHERPLRRQLVYVSDASAGQAFWEMGSNEPGLDLGAGAPGGWLPAEGRMPLEVPAFAPRSPFRFRAPAPVTPPLAAAEVTTRSAPEGVLLDVLLKPEREGLAVVLSLAPGVTPILSNRAGRAVDGRWTAMYGAAPLEGVRFSLTLPAGAETTLAEALFGTIGPVPGAAPGRPPAWLESDRAAWEVRGQAFAPLVQ